MSVGLLQLTIANLGSGKADDKDPDLGSSARGIFERDQSFAGNHRGGASDDRHYWA